MSKFLGGAVLVLGVGALGWYGNGHQAKEMQTRVTQGAAAIAQTTVRGVSTEVSGRDIRVSGLANGQAEHDEIIAALNAVDGRRVVIDELEVLPTVSPFEVSSVKTADSQTYKGVFASDAALSVISGKAKDASAVDLKIAAGVPDAQWDTVALNGISALDGLNSGEMKLSDHMLTVSGVAATPVEKAAAEAVVATLPDGYSKEVNITSVLPTASPFKMSSTKSANSQTYYGSVPSEEARTELSKWMGSNAADLTHAWGAPDDAWPAVAAQGLDALADLQVGEMSLSDQHLIVTGIAATPVEKASAEAKLASLPDGYSKVVNITSALPTAKPYVMRSTKAQNSQSYAGVIPNEDARGEFTTRMGAAASDLDIAYGAPDDAWPAVAGSGLDALARLEKGKMELIDRKLTITGVAMTPTEKAQAMAAIADLPAGYTADVDIVTIDDGKPAAYTILYHPVTGASVDGKLTKDMGTDAIATALGVKRVAGDPVIAPTAKSGNGKMLTKQLSVLSGWLPEFEGFALGFDGKETTIEVKLAPGLDKELVTRQLSDELGDNINLMVTGAAKINVAEGTIRENLATGSEVYMAGFWLPVRKDFEVTAKSCEAQSAQALADTKVNFLTGSAQLDARSVRAINNIAGVVLRCITNEDLMVEIGGHTDSSGALQMNMDLSSARAESVVKELIARGVPQTRIIAKGYGPTEPIASNDNAEGKAENRRTTVRWFKTKKEVEAVAPTQTNTNTTVSE